MKDYIELTPCIPNGEGYIQHKDAKVYINKNHICNICRDLSRTTTSIKYDNGHVTYVTEDLEKDMQKTATRIEYSNGHVIYVIESLETVIQRIQEE